MKDQSWAMQFSGYPLTIADHKQEKKPRQGMTVVKPVKDQTPSVQKNIANDPKNWDITWFNNYE